MTRTQQNEKIIEKLQSQLADMPNVQQVISKSFNQWFQGLVQTAAQSMEQQPSTEEPQPQEEAQPNVT